MFAAMLVASVMPTAVFPPVEVTKEMLVGEWESVASSDGKGVGKRLNTVTEYGPDGSYKWTLLLNGEFNQTHEGIYTIVNGELTGSYLNSKGGREQGTVKVLLLGNGQIYSTIPGQLDAWAIRKRRKN